VRVIERRVGISAVTIEEMREELYLRFERLSKHTDSESDLSQVEEHALYAGAQLKGKCYVCGKIGHKGVNCKDRTSGGGGRFNNNGYGGRGGFGGRFGGRGNRQPTFCGKCNYCHKVGHKAADCRKRQDEAADGRRANGIRILCHLWW
jgi:Zinc knuckle